MLNQPPLFLSRWWRYNLTVASAEANPRDSPVNVKMTGTGGHQIPTFGSQEREMEFSGQLFSRTFVNAAVKTPILGRDF